MHQPRAHRRARLIQQPQQRAALFAVAQRADELQVGDGGVVEHHRLPFFDEAHAVDDAESVLLRLAQVFDQGAAGGDDGGEFGDAEGLERLTAQLLQQVLFGVTGRKRPRHIAGKGRQRPQSGGALGAEQHPVVADDLGGRELHQIFQTGRKRIFPRKIAGAEFARGDVCPGERTGAALAEGAGDVVVLLFVEEVFFDEGARGDDADDVSLHHAAARGGLGELFADGDLFAEGHEAGDIVVGRVVRDAAHGRALFQAAVAPRQRQVQKLRHLFGVFKKHLVKIAEAIEQDAVFVLFFDLQIVPHHGRKSAHFIPLLP